MKINKHYILTLLPAPLFFALIYLLSDYLKRFGVTGPISASSGKPLFYPHYGHLIFYLFLAFLIGGFVFSLYHLLEIKGKLKFLLLALVISFVPIQYIWIITSQVNIFGK